jgi:hypothetical protein
MLPTQEEESCRQMQFENKSNTVKLGSDDREDSSESDLKYTYFQLKG